MILSEFFRLLRFVLLLAVQVLVCNHIYLFSLATPMVYVVLLTRFPQDYPRSGILLWAFAMGLCVDIFTNTPGVGAAAMVLTAMLQPALRRLTTEREEVSVRRQSFGSLDKSRHFPFLVALVVVHHVAYYALESFSYFHVLDVLLGCVLSILLTLLLVWTVWQLVRAKA